MDAYIEFRNVVKKFDDFVALDHVSLQIPKGAFVTLLGPSGCGKTTLMRQLAGFSEPEEGDVLVDGKRMNGLPPFKRNTPLVFQEYALFPHMTVYENISGTKYSTVTSVTFTAKLKNEFAPFLMPNQYVNFSASSKTVAKAQELVGGQSDVLKKVEGIYNYVVKNFTYDKQKAATVQSGYLPNVDTILASKKGICFDYAAVMAAMLRSQNVPTKLVVGYSGKIYHAWISVYSEKTGWVDGAIYFDGTNWKLMDPTFASSANQSKQIMEYIGNGANYSAKYFY